MHRYFLLLCCVLAVSGQVREPRTPQTGAAVPDQYIVMFREGITQSERASIVRAAGASVRYNYGILTAAAITAPNPNALAALGRDMRVTTITPDRIVTTMAKPGTGGGGTSGQTVGAGVTRVGLPKSSTYDVGVAVLDTGVARVQDLNVAPTVFDAYGGTCGDVDGHGTHVSGIIAAIQNSIGILGVAPGATIYCAKVLNDQGSGADSAIIAGLDWVISTNKPTKRISVVNMSLGRAKASDDTNGPLYQAIKRVADAGVIIVAAAGNDASKDVSQMVPAGFSEVLAVASTTATTGTNQCTRLAKPIGADTASYFTTDGVDITISAPGEESESVNRACFLSSTGILSLAPNGGTARMSGTSQAAPHVTGIIARYFAAGANTGNIITLLQSNAAGQGTLPLDSPASSYSFDGTREGIAQERNN